MKRIASAYGFTLLEVMVALVIFVMIGMSASGLLHSLLRSQQAFDSRSRQLEGLQSLLLATRRDLMQMVPRNFIDLKTGAAIPFYDFGSLTFTCQGWSNPLGAAHSGVARVRYAFESGAVTRQLWPAKSKAEAAEFSQPLIDPVDNLQMTPVMQPKSAMPSSVEVSVMLPGLGEVRQLVPMVNAP